MQNPQKSFLAALTVRLGFLRGILCRLLSLFSSVRGPFLLLVLVPFSFFDARKNAIRGSLPWVVAGSETSLKMSGNKLVGLGNMRGVGGKLCLFNQGLLDQETTRFVKGFPFTKQSHNVFLDGRPWLSRTIAFSHPGT